MKKIICVCFCFFTFISAANSAYINIDFSGTGGTLADGTTYSLSGSYSAFGTTGVRLNDQSVIITFSDAVNIQFQSNSLDGDIWNNPADGIVMLDVNGGGILELVSDLDGEIDTVLNNGTDSLGVSFQYNNISGNTGPHGNDYIASNQNWLFSGTIGSTFTISQLNALLPNTNSFEVLAEGAEISQVPEPTSLALLSLGLAGFGFARKKKKA